MSSKWKLIYFIEHYHILGFCKFKKKNLPTTYCSFISYSFTHKKKSSTSNLPNSIVRQYQASITKKSGIFWIIKHGNHTCILMKKSSSLCKISLKKSITENFHWYCDEWKYQILPWFVSFLLQCITACGLGKWLKYRSTFSLSFKLLWARQWMIIVENSFVITASPTPA